MKPTCHTASHPASVLALALALSLPAAAWAEVPQLKPMRGQLDGKADTRPAAKADPKADLKGAAPGAVDTAAPPDDPLEQLRQRLAGRIAGGKTSTGQGPYDVRVVARNPGEPAPSAVKPLAHGTGAAHAPATAAPRGAPRAAAAAGAAVAATPGHGPVHAAWAYQGPAGPQTWGGLRPEFALCGNGQRQSPIDIRGGLPVDLEPVKFNYQPSRFGVIDNGHTVQANLGAGNVLEVGGRRFELVQMHFHRPSEERIDGRQFEMSVHLVHKDEQGKLAVVAILVDKGPPQPAVQKVWNNLPLEKHDEVAARVPLDLSELLPADRRYFTYMGSLTTPPCSEGVQWVVMRQPVTMAPEQIELFARIYPMNARPVQQAAGRRILQSQ
jgi:carbonic anhydrase